MSDMNADGVLRAFYRDAPYLFLGAAFTAVGIVSAAFAVLRRRPRLSPYLFRFVCCAVWPSPLDFLTAACNDTAELDPLPPSTRRF